MQEESKSERVVGHGWSQWSRENVFGNDIIKQFSQQFVEFAIFGIIFS